ARLKRLIRLVRDNEVLVVANNLLSGPPMRIETTSEVQIEGNVTKDLTPEFVGAARGDLRVVSPHNADARTVVVPGVNHVSTIGPFFGQRCEWSSASGCCGAAGLRDRRPVVAPPFGSAPCCYSSMRRRFDDSAWQVLFCSRQSPTARVGPSSFAVSGIRDNGGQVREMDKLFLRLFLFLAIAICSLHIGVGGVLPIWSGHRAVLEYLPVEATILEPKVESRFDSDLSGHVDLPIVRYQYRVNGRLFESTKVFPHQEAWGGRGEWARRIIDQFRVGQVTVAYYDPEEPSQSCLLRRISFMPYGFFTLTPTAFLAFVVFISSHKLDVAASRLTGPIRKRRAVLLLVVWHSVGLLACGHYLFLTSMVGQRYNHVAIMATLLYEGAGCVFLALTLTDDEDTGLRGRVRAAAMLAMFGLIGGAVVGFAGGLLVGGVLYLVRLADVFWIWGGYGVLCGSVVGMLVSALLGGITMPLLSRCRHGKTGESDPRVSQG
ncbi:MAG: DUF3592 domain-containing protein, partial [Planctomycetota bacterium]